MFSLDVTGLLEQAAAIFNGLQGVIVIVAGIGLGFGLLAFVSKLIKTSIKS